MPEYINTLNTLSGILGSDAFKKAIQTNDFHKEIDPKFSIAQAADAMQKTTETKAIILKELEALSARIDLLEALQKGKYDEAFRLTPRALQEFPVFGEEGTTNSFAHYFINKTLPEILPAIEKQEQVIPIVSALLRPEMQVQLPREDYVALITSDAVRNVIEKAGGDALKPLEETLKSLNDSKIFGQKKPFNNQQIKALEAQLKTLKAQAIRKSLFKKSTD